MTRPPFEELDHPGYSDTPCLHVFLDTEFTDLAPEAKLISIGLVDESGEHTFYAELSDTFERASCSEFVREAVLPMLEGGQRRMAMHELTLRLGNWLEDFEQPVCLATDSLSWDWPWIQEIFCTAGTWPANVDGHPILLSMNNLRDYDAFLSTREKSFTAGLRRHHALDDAKANRLGWIAAGGDSERAA